MAVDTLTDCDHAVDRGEDGFVRVGDFELTWDEADVLWGRVGLAKAVDPFVLFPEEATIQ